MGRIDPAIVEPLSRERFKFFGLVAAWCRFKALLERIRSKVVEFGNKTKKLGEEDPRRITHSLKVGLAVAIVSLVYYYEPAFDSFGVSAMWAVLTVVVVFEFSVGATLGKGVNRGIATFVAGSLGVGAHRLASFSGEKFEPIILGLCVFFVASVVSFARFFPRMKARFDYGLMIFILTFSLISVSGYQDDRVLQMGIVRIETILIGGSTAVLICILICPVWAGDDLHSLLASNMEKLASNLQGYGAEYFSTSRGEQAKDKMAFMQEYKSVLNSKTTEENLANFAEWEPRHGRFRYRHPWEQYLKIGALTRQCAYQIEALNGYLNPANKTTQEIRGKIEEPCTKMSLECSYALKELALAMKTMTRSSCADSHVVNAKMAAENLKSLLKTGLWQDTELLDIIPSATVASLLIDVVTSTEKIAESVHELASLARFKNQDKEAVTLEKSTLNSLEIMVKTSRSIEGSHQAITIGE